MRQSSPRSVVAFTLIELLVVLVILVLSATAVLSFC